ncbi:hypothetical protein C8F01DRAFT_1254071 [Mycena amicta]|nr:hypothetical protein C8F01DRAFT_1254071 [Mycena amicta]
MSCIASTSDRTGPNTASGSSTQRTSHHDDTVVAGSSGQRGRQDGPRTFSGRRMPSREPSPDLYDHNGHPFPKRIQLSLRTDSNSHSDYSPSAVTGQKRPRAPAITDDLPIQAQRTDSSSRPFNAISRYPRSLSPVTAEPSPAQRTKTSSRPCVRDLDDQLKEPMAVAIEGLRCWIASNNAFADAAEAGAGIKDVWKLVNETLDTDLPLDIYISKLLMNRFAHTRGEMKTKARHIVSAGFKSGSNKKTLLENRARAELLKEGINIAYADPVNQTGLYKAADIQPLTNAFWFSNRRDEGPSHPEVFKPLPLRALALVLTVMDNCVDEWITGTHTDVPFTANEYRSVYQSHVKSLQAFQMHGAKHQILEKILMKLHNNGRFHSGAQPLESSVPQSALTTDAMDAALAEYEAGNNSDSDAE